MTPAHSLVCNSRRLNLHPSHPHTHTRTSIRSIFSTNQTAGITTSDQQQQPMLKSAGNMSKSILRQAKITPHRSGTRGHSDHGWLNSYHSFSFADWYNPNFTHFGSLRVLNEDRVKANSGFPTHPHRDFEIFSYILSGELTHRDSMLARGKEGGQSDKFYRMHRGDVQFTTGGTGIAHSEMNEHKTDTVHFLQIWAMPWKRGLAPRYHTKHFEEADKRRDFVTILSPLKGGEDATAQQENEAEPAIAGSIPIHADFAMGAGIIAPQAKFEWTVGAEATQETKRKVYVHLPMTKNGKAKIRLDGREDAELAEGDGAFIDGVKAGDKLAVESIGEVEAEVIVLDTA
ncbi:Quercetin 2,3-dioxygenase [Tolypocladium paradoxum]|uniref:Quercetin 2,3-dioxygenase n=1 Tax=Tolypocladium paradoxum TaxID=94208 RepID=A0A2S4KVK3_9HYPO|nr:Quercetin 2,3-dioxygenase [Tolypocladium paradoxum]